MSTTKTILAIIAAAIAIILYMSYFVVDEQHKALVLRFGDINRIVEEPGLYFKLPIADTVTPIEDRIIIWENNDRPVQDVAIAGLYRRRHHAGAHQGCPPVPRNAGRRPDAGGSPRRGASRRGPAPDLWPPLLRCRAVVRPCHHDARDPRRAARRKPILWASRSSTSGCAAPTSVENVLEQTYRRMESERNALAAGHPLPGRSDQDPHERRDRPRR